MLKIQLLIAAAVLTIAPSFAADSCQPNDKVFAQKVLTDGLAEVKLGDLAVQRAGNDKVKKFGEHMVKDHGKANQELSVIADKCGLKLDRELDAKHKAVMARLSKAAGNKFDKQYMTEMVAAHKKAVAAFDAESKNGTGEFKDFAVKTLPTIKEHLKEAQTNCKTM